MDNKLNLPNLPPDFLFVKYCCNEQLGDQRVCDESSNYPFAVSSPVLASVVSAQRLTSGDDVKKVVDLCLKVTVNDVEPHPGDTIGIIPQNPLDEVEEILKYLELLDKADTVVRVCIKEGTLKKKATVPPHIPEKTTLRHLFKACLDIRAVPKKIFLRVLSLYTASTAERNRLEQLCSKEGSTEYSLNIVENRTTLLDLLKQFPSCCPPVERLLEHLPRLQARPYSIASSPLTENREIHIVYSLVELPSREPRGEIRHGICTGWLECLTKDIQTEACSSSSLEKEMEKLSLKFSPETIKIPIYFRKSTGFTLPKDPKIPLILIGPGTGVAPYIGFLKHRLLEKQQTHNKIFGDVWLFFGCRYQERDYIYRLELGKFIDEGILARLFVSFSRDRRSDEMPKYVQDNIRLHSTEFVKQLLEKKAIIYVCGDAKNMGRDVHETVVSIIKEKKGIEEDDAKLLVKELQNQGQYLQDIWL